MLLLIAMVFLSIAGLATWTVYRVAVADRRQAATVATNRLEEAGLTPKGDVFGTFSLHGVVDGVELDLTNRTERLPPGNLEAYVSTCVIQVAMPVADQIVFGVSSIDQVMGLLPTAPRVRTGYAPFDDLYAIFVVSPGETAEGSYRRSAGSNSTPWGHAYLLDRLLELGLLWMRVQEDRAEIVFPPLPLSEIRRAAALAAAIACTPQGKPVPELSVGPRTRWTRWPDPRRVLYSFWGFGALIATLVGMYLSPDDSIGAREAASSLIVLCAIVIAGAVFSVISRGPIP